ncbi:hypothetical protein DL764_000411 [Monosporascus ibericus]|uniref:Alpha/beta hydrolase fold-3 domain-containing protein n=1 Tax=Monosporascus ibericus TaxID=155417 RepID=A0A4V1XCT4_9PEZI|nr:hypothetical protein DL764_000411 [Monosporascus ibericus]
MEPYTIDPAHQHENSIKLLGRFDAYRTAYKYVNSQPIHAFFIIPKQLPPGPRPLLVRFHGGGWTEGEAEASLRPFFLELALKHGAVILTPDYRLRPEHELTEGIEDIRSFWKWVEQDAQQVLRKSLPDLELDVANLLVGGESAGGHHAMQTALLSMTTLPIKVLFVQYPVLDMASFLRLEDDPDEPGAEAFASSSAKVPYSVVEDHLAALEPAWIDPMTSLETAGKLPPILLYHSKGDESIPWTHTERWATKLRELRPDVPLYLTFQTGDHVFDKNHTMETPWLKEPLEFVQKYWPAKQDA